MRGAWHGRPARELAPHAPLLMPQPDRHRSLAYPHRAVQSAARMKVIDLRGDQAGQWESLLSRRYTPEANLATHVSKILSEVRLHGDRALAEFSRRFDQVDLSPQELAVTQAEIETATALADPELVDALQAAHANVRDFALRSVRSNWTCKNEQGAEVGERFDPLNRVGVYVPAGTAPLVSTAIMTLTLARVAGVANIVVTSPVGSHKTMNPGLLTALQFAGATEIYKVGGAQAIAALAFGTETIKPVAKVFGPGNAYVTEAKRQVFGYVAVDLVPGPSEILVIADDTANPRWVAADLLAQAEHGRGSVLCLVALDEKMLASVQHEIARQIKDLTRRAFLQEVLEQNAFFALVKDEQQAIQVVNEFAPEHLSLVTRHAEKIAEAIFTAGAIFIGNFSPVAAGDFLAGPSHELPTGGAAKSFGGLTVDQFQRRTSIVRYDREALAKSASIISQFSHVEELDAHGRSVTIRFE
jgi:histidinol dehydrogenase